MLLTARPELLVLLLHEVRLGEQGVGLGRVCEVARRVDAAELDGARPERAVLRVVVEAGDVSWTANRSQLAPSCSQWRKDAYTDKVPTPRGSQLTMS